MTRRLEVDRSKCLGNARCVGAAPDVFDVDDDGNVLLLTDGVVGDEARDVELAVRSCPTGAIALADG